MKILSWNVNRHDGDLEHESNETRKEHILEHNADVVILTNTRVRFHLGDPYKRIASAEMPSRHDGIDYKAGENRVSIYTKYPFKNKVKTYDSHSSVCQMIETPLGNLNVYGTILGANPDLFESDLVEQKDDLERIEGAICYAGDYNMSLVEPFMPNEEKVKKLQDFANEQKIAILTADFENLYNHVAVSKSFLKGNTTQIELFPVSEDISKEEIIVVTIKEKEIKTQVNNPLHGVKLAYMLEKLVDHYGWNELGDRIRINSFNSNPGFKSSLKFLRKTDWARKKVEDLYVKTFVE
jgi:exonuclease III